MDAAHGTDRDNRPVVRHREVWGGLLAALVGAGLVALGVAALSWTLAGLGAVILVAGAVLALRGGALHDAVAVPSIRTELRGVAAGRAHRGSRAGQMVEDRHLRAAAQAVGERTQTLLGAPRGARSPGLAPVAGWSLVLAMMVAVSSQWEWVARTSTGHATSSRDTVLLTILALCGLRIGTARGPHRVSAAIAGLAGIGLVLAGSLAPHDRVAAGIIELGCGSWAIIAAATAWTSPRGGEPGDDREHSMHARTH